MLREAVTGLLAALCDLFRSRSALLAENTLLRQQVILLHRADRSRQEQTGADKFRSSFVPHFRQ